ncbi:MAG: acyl transferase [Bacteroidota bacterium]|nr:acyl transferase [Bacteroidota bacterium]
MKDLITDKIFRFPDVHSFNEQVLEIFHLQYRHNPVYRNYVNQLGIKLSSIHAPEQIPFLPIEFYKSQGVIWENQEPELVFESSGTSGSIPSKHFVADANLYKQSFTRCFELVFGDPRQYCILALLPSYLERGNSSLVYMLNELIQMTGDSDSGFFLDQFNVLVQTLEKVYPEKKIILIGVTFALLDLVESQKLDFPDLIVMETGGMKGRRVELIREDLHEVLCKGFGVQQIHSEYGMTELLSQAYSRVDGRFSTAPWMQVMVRDLHDPLSYLPIGKTGPLNIIDLANLYSCSFIATQDLGRINPDGTFEVLGRVDDSDVRGCNLLVSI